MTFASRHTRARPCEDLRSGVFNPLKYASSLTPPRYLSGSSAWGGDIPFAMTLVPLLRPRVIVELGAHRGDSYCAFCQAVDENGLATRCFAVDTWRGDIHTGE